MGADFSGWYKIGASRTGVRDAKGDTYLDSSASLTAARVTPARIKKANSTRG